MSGILERVETKLDQLIALLADGVSLPTPPEAEFTAEQAIAHKGNANENPMDIVDPYAGTDKDGVTWDARIHSKAKEPKSVTTGKWKRKKGIQDDLYNTVTAELKATPVVANGPFFWVDTATNVTNTCDTRAEMDQLLTVPTTKEITEAEFDALILEEAPLAPKAPLAPLAPTAPTAPKAPLAPVVNTAKTEVLGLIKELQVTFTVEPNDITMLMKEVTGFDTIDKITDDKMKVLSASLTSWFDAVECATLCVKAMHEIAAPHGLTPDLNAGIEGILEPHDADRVGIVHYSVIGGVCDQLEAYLATWKAI